MAGVACAVYAAFSVGRHLRFETGIDLGIFDQALWHYSRFEAPESTIFHYHPSLLGDHFHPIVIVLTPLYWIWSDPIVLLLAQAILVAASVVPVFLFSVPRVGRGGAYLVAAAYALYWAIHAAIAYDFHEVAFAPLLIALAILFADRRQWVPYFAAVSLLLAVKEDMAFVVVFLGLFLLARRSWRPAIASIALGVAWWYAITKLVIPAFADGRPFLYWTYTDLGGDLGDALKNIATHPDKPFRLLVDHHEKVRTLAYLFLPFLGLTLLSPIGLLAIPLVAERMYSTKTGFWRTEFHYSLAIAPVVVMGAVDGLRNLLRLVPIERLMPRAATVGAASMLLGSFVASAKISPLRTDAGKVLKGSPAQRAYGDAVRLVGPDASVGADFFLVPHVSERRLIYYFEFGMPETDYILVRDPGPYAREARGRSARYATIFHRDGLRVLERRTPAPTTVRPLNPGEPAK